MSQEMEDLRQSPEYGCYMEKIGWQVARLPTKPASQAFIRRLSFLGALVKIQRPAVIPPRELLDLLAKQSKALFIKIEPAETPTVMPPGFAPDSWPLLPSQTRRVELTVPETQLWQGLDPDARYSIRRVGKTLATEVMSLNDPKSLSALGEFHTLLHETGHRKDFHTPSWHDLAAKAACFGHQGHLLLARRKNTPIAGALLLGYGEVGYYHHAANSKEGRALLAGYLVLWETIRLAQQVGYHYLDLEGIYDARFPKATDTWQGFTKFKEKFGGEVITFPAPRIKYYSLPIQALFKLFG